MIRVIRFTVLGVLVLALGLGPIGCGGETTSSKGMGPAEKSKKEEQMKKAMEQKDATGSHDGKADEKNKAKEDKSKNGDNDK
jgi:hypothetical protein